VGCEKSQRSADTGPWPACRAVARATQVMLLVGSEGRRYDGPQAAGGPNRVSSARAARRCWLRPQRAPPRAYAACIPARLLTPGSRVAPRPRPRPQARSLAPALAPRPPSGAPPTPPPRSAPGPQLPTHHPRPRPALTPAPAPAPASARFTVAWPLPSARSPARCWALRWPPRPAPPSAAEAAVPARPRQRRIFQKFKCLGKTRSRATPPAAAPRAAAAAAAAAAGGPGALAARRAAAAACQRAVRCSHTALSCAQNETRTGQRSRVRGRARVGVGAGDAGGGPPSAAVARLKSRAGPAVRAPRGRAQPGRPRGGRVAFVAWWCTAQSARSTPTAAPRSRPALPHALHRA
jgi:hypothetical protein